MANVFSLMVLVLEEQQLFFNFGITQYLPLLSLNFVVTVLAVKFGA